MAGPSFNARVKASAKSAKLRGAAHRPERAFGGWEARLEAHRKAGEHRAARNSTIATPPNFGIAAMRQAAKPKGRTRAARNLV